MWAASLMHRQEEWVGAIPFTGALTPAEVVPESASIAMESTVVDTEDATEEDSDVDATEPDHDEDEDVDATEPGSSVSQSQRPPTTRMIASVPGKAADDDPARALRKARAEKRQGLRDAAAAAANSRAQAASEWFHGWDSAVTADRSLPAVALLLAGLVLLARRHPTQPLLALWAMRVAPSVTPESWNAIRRRCGGRGRFSPLALPVTAAASVSSASSSKAVLVSSSYESAAAACATAEGLLATPLQSALQAAHTVVERLAAHPTVLKAAICDHLDRLQELGDDSAQAIVSLCSLAECQFIVASVATESGALPPLSRAVCPSPESMPLLASALVQSIGSHWACAAVSRALGPDEWAQAALAACEVLLQTVYSRVHTDE
jgi:hypothetical protein